MGTMVHGLLINIDIANRIAALSANSHENKKTMAVWKPTKGEKAINTANDTENASLRGQRSFLKKERIFLYIDLIIISLSCCVPIHMIGLLYLL